MSRISYNLSYIEDKSEEYTTDEKDEASFEEDVPYII